MNKWGGSCECGDKISGLTTSRILEEKLPVLHLPDVTMKVTYQKHTFSALFVSPFTVSQIANHPPPPPAPFRSANYLLLSPFPFNPFYLESPKDSSSIYSLLGLWLSHISFTMAAINVIVSIVQHCLWVTSPFYFFCYDVRNDIQGRALCEWRHMWVFIVTVWLPVHKK